jgi:hypothetical protein
LTLPLACFAQQWEVGGAGGFGFYRNVTASSPAGSAKVGFKSGAALSAVGTQNIRRYLGGEARYVFSLGDLKINGSGGARMNGEAHSFLYDFLVYGARQEAAVRPFLAAGAGAKWYRGTGPEVAFQPLSGIALLTRSSEFKPLVSVGGGLKFLVGKHAIFRVDFRDHATPFPRKVITPRPPSGTVNGWLHDFLILAGVGLAF